ncbi:hypothetical protein HY631_00490 [Candidatus Uhrbacteria bacterium]|nr:hypothetical protein [Candidatus Uhrbacteria bacterium]
MDHMFFTRMGATDALSTFIRASEDGVTDSRPHQARQLVAAGAATAQWDEILEGFVSDPAIFAAAVSHLATAHLDQGTLDRLAQVRSRKQLTAVMWDCLVSAGDIQTENQVLRRFLQEVLALGKDGQAWFLLVAAHLSTLRADVKLRPLVYHPQKKELS